MWVFSEYFRLCAKHILGSFAACVVALEDALNACCITGVFMKGIKNNSNFMMFGGTSCF